MLAKVILRVVIGSVLLLGVNGCGSVTNGNGATDTASGSAILSKTAYSKSNAASSLGTNTNEVTDNDSSMPFIDLFRAAIPFEESRPWTTKGNIVYDTDGWPMNLNGGQAGSRFLSN